MSLINMQDGFVKSPLVQAVQARHDEVARIQDRANIPFNQELARQADEVVLESREAENQTVHEKDEEEERKRKRRRQKQHGEQDDDAENDEPEAPPAGPRRLDIMA